jgi:hypothetical protein
VLACASALLLVCRCAPAADPDIKDQALRLLAGDFHDEPPSCRNYLDLLRVVPEVTRGNTSLNSTGQREQNNNFLVDGMDNNDSWLRGPVLEPSIEAIESVSLATVYVSSELGRATGAAVNVQTRAGSNRFHASLFGYLQNSALNARNFFDGAHKPGLVQNQFGGNAGGPLHKEDWFFFFNADLSREHRGLTVISTVPTAAQKEGDFGNVLIYDPLSIYPVTPVDFLRLPFPGNRIPPGLISLQARKLIALYPDANLPGEVSNYRFTPTLVRNGDKLDFRTDKVLSARSTLFVRFSDGRHDVQSPGALPGLAGSDSIQHANGTNTSLRAWGGILSHTLTVRPSLTNEFRAGVNRMDVTAYALDRGLNASAALGIPGLGSEGLPVVSPMGYAQLGAAGPAPMKVRTTSYQIEDAVLWTRRGHTFKFGFQAIRRHADGTASEWTSRGTFLFTPDYTSQVGVAGTGNAIASLLTGYPAEVRRDVQYEPFRLRGWEWAGFIQDEIRLWRRLTIQVGVRSSLYPPVTEASNRMVNFNYVRATPALDQFAGQGGVNKYAGVGYDKTAFAPRFGFALDLSRNGSTVLRGGFSQMFDAGEYLAQGRLARNPPYATRQDIFGGSLQLGLSLGDGLPAPERAALLDAASLNRVHGAIYAVEPTVYTPYSDQWGLSVQQRLRPGLTLEVGGSASMGMHLYGSLNINQPYPAPSPYQWRRYPFEPYVSRIELLGLGAGSTYYGGQVKLSGELRPGLQLMTFYRYAKAEDDAPAPSDNELSRPPGAQYIYTRGTRGASSFDIAHRLVLTASYDVPSGNSRAGRSPGSRLFRWALADWRASSVVIVQTGVPFTPQLALNGLNNGGYQLPNRLGDGSLPSGQRSYLHWFNTSLDPADPNRAFETPPLYQYGNSGYNIIRGPGLATVDAAMARRFLAGSGAHLSARIEAYNLFNRANFALPNRILGLANSGAINRTSTPARQIQLALGLEW